MTTIWRNSPGQPKPPSGGTFTVVPLPIRWWERPLIWLGLRRRPMRVTSYVPPLGWFRTCNEAQQAGSTSEHTGDGGDDR